MNAVSPRITILVVDDESVTRLMVRRVLRDAAFDVVEAENGEQAVRLCGEAAPDLVLLDVRMPVMNGFDACRAIRQLPRLGQVPILMLTALDDTMAVSMAFEAGATDFVTKPINWALLGQRVHYALRNSRTERKLRESQQVLAKAQKIARLGQWGMQLSADVLQCSPEVRQMLGLAGAGDVRIEDMLTRLVEADQPRLRDFIAVLRDEGKERDIEVRVAAGSAGTRYVHLSADVVLDDTGTPDSIFGVAQDVTERRETEAKLDYYDHFDPLTGLPNPVLLRDRLNGEIASAQAGGPPFAVFEVEADALRKLRPITNHLIADRMLKALVQRIASSVTERDTISRLDGERFMLLVTGVRGEVEAAGTARRLMAAFEQPLQVDEWEVMSAVRIGVAIYPSDGGDADALLSRAGAALARVGADSATPYQFYADGFQRRVSSVIETQVALFRGLERREFELHYQPIVDLRSGAVAEVEALLRWRRPDAGLQLPQEFLWILEESGMIVEVGDWVLRVAGAAMRELPVTLAVNVSPRQFRDPQLAGRLVGLLEDVGFPPQRLVVEITERVAMADDRNAAAMLNDLATRGVRTALDDYGTGFSSLRRLKMLPLDALKIDRYFVSALMRNQADAAIVRSTIELCHELGIKVVAEGVEDQDTMNRLRQLDCDLVQGFAVARPMPIEELNAWLARSKFAPADSETR